jgi:hypothetical protein
MRCIALFLLLTTSGFAQRADLSDGSEPYYTVDPVTQRVAHCPAGQKLMVFDPAYHYMNAIAGNAMTGPDGSLMPPEHDARWLPAGTSGGEQLLKAGTTYRCFEGEKHAEFQVNGPADSSQATTVSSIAIPPGRCGTDIPCTVAMPKGTKCGPEGEQIVCHMPENPTADEK